MRRLERIAAIALTTMAFGCATMKHGGQQAIDVASTPAGAAIEVRCGVSPQPAAVTPTTVLLSRSAQPCELTVSSPGYQSQTVAFERRIAKAFWGNLGASVALGAAGLVGTEPCRSDSFCIFSPADVGAMGVVVGLIPAYYGMMRDANTGAMYEKIPKQVNVTLVPAPAAAPAPTP